MLNRKELGLEGLENSEPPCVLKNFTQKEVRPLSWLLGGDI